MDNSSALFQFVRENNPPGNNFKLSHTVRGTTNIGQIIPILCDECVPGDVWNIGYELGLRCQPLVAPIMDHLIVEIDYFFVPYRLLFDNWEQFITGGKDGNYTTSLPTMSWTNAVKGTFWDYLGLPLATDVGISPDNLASVKAKPLAFPWLAYNMILFDYYIDQNFPNSRFQGSVPNQLPYSWDDLTSEEQLNNSIAYRAYKKDYFTSALPFQQRGTAPSLPLSGFAPVGINLGNGFTQISVSGATDNNSSLSTKFSTMLNSDDVLTNLASSNNAMFGGVTAGFNGPSTFQLGDIVRKPVLTDASGLSTFTVPDMRLAFQIQKWMEMNARGGSRYVEFLQAHFGVSPRDETLQRPQFLGRVSQRVLISEVLQHSESSSTSALGDMAGHGISYAENHVDTFRCTEYGLIIGLMSVMPTQSYFQGINRQWLRRSRFDFYFPEFANLSEQGIYNAEIFVSDDSSDPDSDFLDTINGEVFGFQGRYDEMRIKQNKIVGQMRDTFDYWHLARKFTTLPNLGSDFITVDPTDFKRIFAVQDEDQLYFEFNNVITSRRPLPAIPDPGLIDHVY